MPPYTPRVCYQPKDAKQVLEILNQHKDGRIRVVGSGPFDERDREEHRRQHRHERIPQSQWRWFHRCRNDARSAASRSGKEGKTLPARAAPSSCRQSLARSRRARTDREGSGLSHYVDAVRIAAYDEMGNAKVFDFDKRHPELRAARTALGAMGVILGVKLHERPAYFIEQSLVGADDISSVLERDETGALQYPLQLFIRLPYEWSYVISRRRESPRGPRACGRTSSATRAD
jgi:hypothetical protein